MTVSAGSCVGKPMLRVAGSGSGSCSCSGSGTGSGACDVMFVMGADTHIPQCAATARLSSINESRVPSQSPQITAALTPCVCLSTGSRRLFHRAIRILS